MEKYKCQQCGKKFLQFPCKKQQFCSLKCFGKFKRGKPHPIPPLTEDHKRKISLSQLGKPRPQTSDEKNGEWKGEYVGYCSLHNWIKRKLGQPNSCSECGKIGNNYQIQWSNIDHKYHRNLDDWRRLCIRCHREYDKQLNNS